MVLSLLLYSQSSSYLIFMLGHPAWYLLQTALKMYKTVGEERFLLWAVCSIQLQVRHYDCHICVNYNILIRCFKLVIGEGIFSSLKDKVVIGRNNLFVMSQWAQLGSNYPFAMLQWISNSCTAVGLDTVKMMYWYEWVEWLDWVSAEEKCNTVRKTIVQEWKKGNKNETLKCKVPSAQPRADLPVLRQLISLGT
jgi:hypothetical protein